MPYTLKGRRVLITAGSRGLGALVAKRFGAEGCNVAVNYASSREAAAQVVGEVERGGTRAISLQGVSRLFDSEGVMKGETRLCSKPLANTRLDN